MNNHRNTLAITIAHSIQCFNVQHITSIQHMTAKMSLQEHERHSQQEIKLRSLTVPNGGRRTMSWRDVAAWSPSV